MGLLNFADNGKREPAAPWTKKVGKVLAAVFDLDTGTQPVARVADKETFTEIGVAAGTTIIVADLWKVYNDRKSVYKDIEEMDHSDEIVSTALDIMADCSVSYSDDASNVSFQVNSDNKAVEKILRACARRLKIDREIWQLARNAYKHGNEFREVILDRSVTPNRIKGFKQTVSYHIWPKTNEHGDKIPGWLVITDKDVTMTGGKELEEWQIVPFFYGDMAGTLAIAPLASARKNWMRLATMEDNMVVNRLTRNDRIVHRVPVKDSWNGSEIMATIKKYKDAITKRRLVNSDGAVTNVDNPLTADSDFYVPDDGSGKGGVTMLSPNNAQLGNLNDVYYHRERLVIRLKVPMSYLQIMSSQKTHLTASAKGSSNVELQFARTLRMLQGTIKDGLHRLFDMELMLHGIAPTEDLYEIEMTKINTSDAQSDAEIELTYAQAAVYFIEAFGGALPPDLLASKYMRLTKEQQAMMDKFLESDAKRMWDAKLKSIEAGAEALTAKSDLTKDRTPGNNATGSGNNNKPRAKRTTEQKGKKATPTQGVSLEDVVGVFAEYYEAIAENLRSEGQDIPAFNDMDREEIRQALLQRVTEDGELVLS